MNQRGQWFPAALVIVALALHGADVVAGRGIPVLRSQKQRYDLKEMTAMEIIRQVARNHPDVTMRILRQVTSQLGGEQGEMYRRTITNMLDAPTDGSSCNLCKILIRLLQAWGSVVTYPDMERTIVEFCELLLTALDESTNSKVICPGTIKLQGPHAYSMILRATPEEICEGLNACYVESPIDPTWPARPSAASGPSQPKASSSESKSSPAKTKSGTPRAGVVRIAQLTDVHVELDYLENSANDCGLYVCCQAEYTNNNNAGYWGDYNCNVPQRTVQLFLDKVRTDINPDFIIFSGDVPPHTVWDETLSSQFQCTETLVQMMTNSLRGKRILPCIGNHEMYPTNLFSTKNLRTETVPLLLKFANLWQTIAGFDQNNINTFQNSGYYTTLLTRNLRLVAIMTNYMYSANFYNAVNHKVPTADSLNDGEALPVKEEIANMLARAREAGEKVILVGHHVVGNSDYIVREAKWFEQLTTEYSDIIVLQLAGHTHSDEFRLLFDADGTTAKSMVYVCPSIDSHGTVNPSIRVYEFDDETWEMLDYTQYYFDLKLTGNGETPMPNITRLYSAREEYGLADLSPASWLDLLNRFMNDESLILKHINHESANAGTPKTSCDDNCRLNHVCRQRYASYDRYQQCTQLFNPSTTTVTTTTTTRPTLPILTPPLK